MPKLRYLVGAAMAYAVLNFILQPRLTQQVLALALTSWWDRTVPILFPSLILAQLAITLFPECGPLAPSLVSLASFPWAGNLIVINRQRTGRWSDQQCLQQLAWSNLYNPLLFTHPAIAVNIDIITLLVAYLATGLPLSSPPSPLALRHSVRASSARLQSIPISAMNWATMYGGAVVAAHLLALQVSRRWILLAVDPMGIFMPTAHQPQTLALFLVVGGLGWMIVLVYILPKPLAVPFVLTRSAQIAMVAVTFNWSFFPHH